MPAPSSPPWTSGSTGHGYRRHIPYINQDTRVSDAERNEVADLLSKHYGDGRLDEAEFNERIDRAMKAKTRSDFRGLLSDLPDLPDQPGTTPSATVRRYRARRRLPRILFLAVVVLVAATVARALAWWDFPFLLIPLVALAFLLYRADQRRRSSS